MTDAGVFPRSVDPTTALDFYLQACSIEVDTAVGANVAATLAAGGVCPLTGERCLSAVTTKATLTLMFSCGMYDYSGEWMSTVDLPAKSGVSGIIYVVVPHIMGISVFSPPLDSHGNSVRGVEFCKRLLREYNFGVFDQIVSGDGSKSQSSTCAAVVSIPRAIPPASVVAPLATASATSRGGRPSPAPHHNGTTSSRIEAAAAAGSVLSAGSISNASDPRLVAAKGHSSGRQAGSGAASVLGPGEGSVLGGVGRSVTASGQRVEKVRRIGLAFRRISRAWMLLRAWSGLPIAAGDLAILQVCKRVCEITEPLRYILRLTQTGLRRIG